MDRRQQLGMLCVVVISVLLHSCFLAPCLNAQQAVPRQLVPVPAEVTADPAPVAEVEVKAPVFVDLLASDLSETWKHYHAEPSVPLAAVWKIVLEGEADKQERVLVCSGQPKGFLYTNESFADFELTLQWKFPTDANGNSGVLVYTQDEARIWPTSMQIQFHQPKAGSVFPSGEAKSDNKTEKTDLARPINQWNDCRIISRSGRLTVEINGTNAGETTGSVPSAGSIALQSEGAEVHFRRVRIRRLEPLPPPVTAPPASNTVKSVEDTTSPQTESQ